MPFLLGSAYSNELFTLLILSARGAMQATQVRLPREKCPNN